MIIEVTERGRRVAFDRSQFVWLDEIDPNQFLDHLAFLLIETSTINAHNEWNVPLHNTGELNRHVRRRKVLN